MVKETKYVDNDKRLVFECIAINTLARKQLKMLEREGILKQVRITKSGSLDKRMTKKEMKYVR